MEHNTAIFCGRSNPLFAERIANHFGKSLGEVVIHYFSDKEIYVHYKESIRGKDIFIIQSTPPPGDNIIELLLMLDAARRASAKSITAVIPYFGYARQDRKEQPRVPIAAKLISNLYVQAGADRILTIDLHTDQIQGFIDIPLDHLYASKMFISRIIELGINNNLVVAAPDMGGIIRARTYAKKFDTELVLIDKRRPQINMSEVVHIIGNVNGKNILIVDDILDTGGTLVKTAEALKTQGAKNIYATITHPILSPPSYKSLTEDKYLSKIFVTDTIPLKPNYPKIEVVSVAEIFADAIKRITTGTSISTLFQ